MCLFIVSTSAQGPGHNQELDGIETQKRRQSLPCQDYNLKSHRGKKKIIDKQAQQMLKARGVVEGSHSLPYSAWGCETRQGSGAKKLHEETQTSPQRLIHCRLLSEVSYQKSSLDVKSRVDVKRGISTGLKCRALLSSPSSHGRRSSGL